MQTWREINRYQIRCMSSRIKNHLWSSNSRPVAVNGSVMWRHLLLHAWAYRQVMPAGCGGCLQLLATHCAMPTDRSQGRESQEVRWMGWWGFDDIFSTF